MLIKVINYLTNSLLNKLSPTVYFGPLAIVPNSNSHLSIRDLLDGIVWATPKHRRPIKKIWSRRYGNENWKFGQKLFKPKRNIISCMECGNFHELHAICRNCYSKVEEESKKIIESIRSAWAGNAIDKEVQFLYQGESAVEGKRIVELERPRPMWFAQNLRQKAANAGRQITGPTIEAINTTVRIKDDDERKE